MNQNHKKIFVLHQDGGVFYQLKDFLKEEIEKQQIETVFMEKSPEDENEILEIVENQIWQEIVDDEKNFLAQKEEDPASFETDLFKVFKACQAGKIERLYLNYRISSNEVNLNLFNDNLMGDEPRFKAIEEIYIWLAYKTLEYGGEIFPSECEENKNKLVAKLRY